MLPPQTLLCLQVLQAQLASKPQLLDALRPLHRRGEANAWMTLAHAIADRQGVDVKQILELFATWVRPGLHRLQLAASSVC